MRKNKTRTLVEGALMIAMATVLAYIKLFNLPQGGSITLEMIPLVIMGLRNGGKWGCFTGFVHGVLQMVLGFQNVMYCATLASQIACILLDYLVAFTVLGCSGFLANRFENRKVGITVATVVVCLARYLCSFLSGVLVWGAYAPEGTPVWIYSLTYNGSYMIPDTIITAVVCFILAQSVPKIMELQNPKAV